MVIHPSQLRNHPSVIQSQLPVAQQALYDVIVTPANVNQSLLKSNFFRPQIVEGSKIRAAEIVQEDPVLVSVVKDTSVVRFPSGVRGGIEDSIIYGKFDNLLHGSLGELPDVLITESQSGPQ